MAQRALAAVLLVVLASLPVPSLARSGILEIRSEPSGARIWIDGVDSGTTPYQNLEMPAGKKTVKVVLGPDYPPQVQEVIVDEKSPQVLLFRFLDQPKGTFMGKETVRTTTKYKGSVTFASIPTGAAVVINGVRLPKTTPIGFADVEVGKYRAEFVLDGRTLQTDFGVVQDQTVKLIADFSAGKVINRWEEALQEAAQKEAERREAEAAKLREAKHEEVQPSDAGRQPGQDPQPAAVPDGMKPVAAPDAPPYGELMVVVDVRRDADAGYSDIFDVAFPKLPVDSLSGALFPKGSGDGGSVLKDNIEYLFDPDTDTRQFTGRIEFSARQTQAVQTRARTSIMTVKEGTYRLKLTRQRIKSGFYSVEKLLNESAQEEIEIVRGNRLLVQVDSHIGGENKLSYQIRKVYAATGAKKQSPKAAAKPVSDNSSKEIRLWPQQD